MIIYPDNKIPGANMGHTWVLLAPGGPHVGPMNLVIWVTITLERLQRDELRYALPRIPILKYLNKCFYLFQTMLTKQIPVLFMTILFTGITKFVQYFIVKALQLISGLGPFYKLLLEFQKNNTDKTSIRRLYISSMYTLLRNTFTGDIHLYT